MTANHNHNHTHPKDCPDQKAAATDRKQHESAREERQKQQQVLAHAEWFEWYPVSERKLIRGVPRAQA
jgi:hypothetical protein